jgi:hypothetical protein
MPFSDPQARQNASAQGPKLETVLCSEVTLVPFPPGAYRIVIGGMEHPAKNVANTAFPAMQVTVLPGCRQAARLDTADGTTAWLDRVGGQTLLRVAAPGGLVLFTAYRPHDYPTTGIRMDVERIKQPEAQAAPQAPTAPPQSPAMQAPGFPQAPSFPQAPGFPQAQPSAQPAAFQQPGAFQNPASPQGFSLTPPASGGFPAAGGGFSQPQFPPQGFQPQPFQPSPGAGFLGGQVPGGFGAANPGFRPAAPQPFPQRPFSPQAASRPQQAAPIAQAAPTPSDASVPGIRMAGHIEMEGDKAFEPGQTAGVPGSARRLEAVALYAEGLNLHELEYAAVSRDGHLLPWVCPPQFTGSRGMGAPLIGFAARLSGETAARYDIVYSGSFFQGGQAGPVGNGEFLKSPVPGDPLESLRVTLTSKKA